MTFDHDLFLLLNFDGGATLDRVMLTLSGTTMWLPLYALILWLVWRRNGWHRTLLFCALILLALALADMVAGIFKHSGLLGDLFPGLPPRLRPMFTPALEGLDITPDSLSTLRHAAPADASWTVHVPQGALGGRYGTISAHASTTVALAVLSAGIIRRRWFTWLGIAAALLICYSRIYLAKHFPVDLLLGTGVGILTGLFMLWLYKKSGRGFFKPLDPSGKQQAE